jgi:hypothetical protein
MGSFPPSDVVFAPGADPFLSVQARIICKGEIAVLRYPCWEGGLVSVDFT